MRKIFWIGILILLPMLATGYAQTSCSLPGGGTCRFQCQAGDYITIDGEGGPVSDPDIPRSWFASIFVQATCGGVTAQCDARDGGVCDPGWCESAPVGCSRSSTPVPYDDDNGTCSIQTPWGFGSCSSVTPEETAEMEVSGQSLVIRIPEP
jgi:hypothetical protein